MEFKGTGHRDTRHIGFAISAGIDKQGIMFGFLLVLFETDSLTKVHVSFFW